MIRRSALASLTATLAVGLAALAATAPAQAASSFTITGAGFGHGVGMSQYGAMGMAQAGFDYRQILGHYYSHSALGHASSGDVVRVLLQSAHAPSFTGATKAGSRSLNPSKTYRVVASGSNVVLEAANGKRLATYGAPLVVTGNAPLRLNGTATNGLSNGRYRGWFEFRPSSGHVLAINGIGLEQYVAGVVSAESPSSWPLAALEAQAVAARSYAITSNAGGSLGFTQYADTRSQMYLGVAAETSSTNQAVNGTRGVVVTYSGSPVTAFFFSTSGGRTEDNEDSFLGASPLPYLRSVSDPYDSVSPEHRWRPIQMSIGHASSALRGLFRGRFLGIKVLERGASPRIMYALVRGTKGSVKTTGPSLRARLGLRDTWAYFRTIITNPKKKAAPKSKGGGAQSASVTRSLTGRVVPLSQGARFIVQERLAGKWVRVARPRAGRGGTYSARVARAGLYRVVVGGAPGPAVRVR